MSACTSSTTSSPPPSSAASSTSSCAGGAAPHTHELGPARRWARARMGLPESPRVASPAAPALPRVGGALQRCGRRLRAALPARTTPHGGPRPGPARYGGRHHRMDRQQPPQARRGAPAALPRRHLVREPLVSRGPGHGARCGSGGDLAALAPDRDRRCRLGARRWRGATRLREPLAERPARRLGDRRALRRGRAAGHRGAPAQACSERPAGNSPWSDGVSWVRCTFLSWSPK